MRTSHAGEFKATMPKDDAIEDFDGDGASSSKPGRAKKAKAKAKPTMEATQEDEKKKNKRGPKRPRTKEEDIVKDGLPQLEHYTATQSQNH